MKTAIVLFTRDLRVRDHPALQAAAGEAEQVVPLFVFDEAILRGDFARPNRLRFLLESLGDLARSLERLGAPLVVRRGDPAAEVARLAREAGARAVHVSADVSAHARRRAERLASALGRIELRQHPGTTVVPPDAVTPTDGDHFQVFTPYYRRWANTERRPLAPPPRRLRPAGVEAGRLPGLGELVDGACSPDLMGGGEAEGQRRLDRFLRAGLPAYGERNDDLAADATSRLSPFLHFGCLSPLELVTRAAEAGSAGPFIRQVAWRDFHHQVTAAFPRMPRQDYRPRGDRWQDDGHGLEAWKAGQTGIPLVDAGMRQLAREGWMHNRARLVVASFLTKDLYVDWRAGAAHFWDLLVDGDIANNAGNWQWVAGTGNDTRPNRIFNPIRQAERFDPSGDYVRRYVPELAAVDGRAVHQPWKLDPELRRRLAYPEPIVDHAEAAAAFQSRRRSSSS